MSNKPAVFEDVPDVVDCDILEAAKENVQPLAAGRRVTALSSILSTPHAQRESKLASTRQRLRMNLDIALNDTDGDPLEAYCQLVYWTLENYPEGNSAESGLLELLEESTRVLKDHEDGKWTTDLEYLKLWLLYASFVEKPTIIYRFLLANDIGTDFGLLYEEYAAVLEREGRRKEADQVYSLGIARKASPLEHLKSRYADFQKRMMTAAPIVIAPREPTIPSSTSKRRALAVSSATSEPFTSSSGATPHSRTASTSNVPVQVFIDPTGADSQSDDLELNAWPDIGTRKTRIKENVPETKKLRGTTIKQAGLAKRVAASSTSSRIVPYMDPTPEEMSPPPVPVKSSAGKSGFVPFVDDVSPSVPEASTKKSKSTSSKSSTISSVEVPATPKFTPFRDESSAVTSPSTRAPESVMQIKHGDVRSSAPITEAEALRKDPLKNYALGNEVILDDS
ncbi:Mad3/BUB1 homology region 1-domain-containing protein [Mycena floridula]|nr:Mad3/BUB1 homology region 1-domain-containing protein [Mycena floridula]